MSRTLLALNSGSSSLKASLFRADGTRRNLSYAHIGDGFPHDHAEAFDALLKDLGGEIPDAIGHRFVHGGDIDDAALGRLAQQEASGDVGVVETVEAVAAHPQFGRRRSCSDRLRWNAVSKHATCGTSKRAWHRSMPSRLPGRCSGARGTMPRSRSISTSSSRRAASATSKA